MFNIGQEVKWQVGNIISYGIVRGDNGEEYVEVVAYNINGMPTRRKLSIKRELLCKED